ncbi:hypothetical protein PybrP1_010619 [[Pythium] brassicae (nom. inval.)]|nr:hypothetical protein PybrP1_010619 [[Pythium] brassicae (nom. inval.)]
MAHACTRWRRAPTHLEVYGDSNVTIDARRGHAELIRGAGWHGRRKPKRGGRPGMALMAPCPERERAQQND